MSALKRRWAPLRKSVPSRTTSPAIDHSKSVSRSNKGWQELTRQFEILVLNLDEVPIFAQLRRVEVAHGYTEFSETNKLFTVKACGVGEDTTSVNNGDRLVVRQKNFV
jgi:hypothetical protein